MVDFITAAAAYHFCLSLPAAFTQPGTHLLAEPCTVIRLIRDLQEVLELGPPEVRLDDDLALRGEALHAADDKVELGEGLHGEVEFAY